MASSLLRPAGEPLSPSTGQASDRGATPFPRCNPTNNPLGTAIRRPCVGWVGVATDQSLVAAASNMRAPGRLAAGVNPHAHLKMTSLRSKYSSVQSAAVFCILRLAHRRPLPTRALTLSHWGTKLLPLPVEGQIILTHLDAPLYAAFRIAPRPFVYLSYTHLTRYPPADAT